MVNNHEFLMKNKRHIRKNRWLFNKWCELYFTTRQWYVLRRSVIDRCNNICERCGKQKVVDIHHVTYKNLGLEKLSDLVGLCRECHEEKHNKNRNPELLRDVLTRMSK